MLRHFPFPSAFSRTKLLMQAFPNETFGSCDLNLTAFAAAEILLFACSDCLTTDTKQRISLLWDTSHIRKGCDKILRFQRLACDIFPTFWAAKKPYQNGRVFACFLSVIRVGSVTYPIFFRAKKWTCFEVKRSKYATSSWQVQCLLFRSKKKSHQTISLAWRLSYIPILFYPNNSSSFSLNVPSFA